MSDADRKPLFERIYEVIRQVPPGMVATYGDIAAIVTGCDARTVGYALNSLPKSLETDVPWQRIINSAGGISTRGPRQRRLLEAEGIVFNSRDLIDLTQYRWPGPDPEWAASHGYAVVYNDENPQLRLF